MLETGDVVGCDPSGRVVITLAIEDWLLEKLETFGAGDEDLEPSEDLEGDGGPSVDHEGYRRQVQDWECS